MPLVGAIAAAQSEVPAAAAIGAPAVPARQWAADAAKNEVKVIQYDRTYLRYRIHTIDSKGDRVRDVIESKDGTVARLIYKEGRSLTSEEDTAEHERLQAMLDSPAAFARHVKGDVNGKKMAVEMINLMPDAMIFTYAPGQPQRTDAASNPNAPADVVIDFKPNPAWNPPNMASEALTGLEGRLWVDRKSHHVTRMDGHIFQGVNFGFGVFAHIYPGGQLSLEQTSVGPDRWIFSHFVENVTVRALMFKTFRENSDIQAFGFDPVPPMTYTQAIRLLLSTPLPSR